MSGESLTPRAFFHGCVELACASCAPCCGRFSYYGMAEVDLSWLKRAQRAQRAERLGLE